MKFLKLNLRENSSGVAMVEFALMIPLLVLLMLGALDMGFAADRYFTLTRISYEGARYGAGISGLEEGSYAANSEEFPVLQEMLRRRVFNLLDANGIDTAEVSLRTALQRRADPASGYPDNIITVEIDNNFEPPFSILGDLALNVAVDSPYLYKLPI